MMPTAILIDMLIINIIFPGILMIKTKVGKMPTFVFLYNIL